MNCRHGYFLGDTIFSSFWTPRDAIFWCFEADVVKNVAPTRNQERNWQTGMGSLKVHQELLIFLSPTLHVQLPCETLGLLPDGGLIRVVNIML